MESWRTVWRQGIVPQLSPDDLATLRLALLDDDEHLLQGATTSPPPLSCVQNWPVEACCILGFSGWKIGLQTVAAVEEYFANVCFEADRLLNEPAAVRWFLGWYDETPRDTMRRELLEEVDLALTTTKGEHTCDLQN